MDYSGSEKRKSKRVDQPYDVRFRPKTGRSEPWNLVLVRDISNGGLLFNHDKDLTLGVLLNLKINVGLEELPIQCTGKVLRCRMLNQSEIYEVAVQFTDLGPVEKEQINRAVERAEFQKEKEKRREIEDRE